MSPGFHLIHFEFVILVIDISFWNCCACNQGHGFMIGLFCLLQAHVASQLGKPIDPPMDEMPDASDLGACELLPDMDLDKPDETD